MGGLAADTGYGGVGRLEQIPAHLISAREERRSRFPQICRGKAAQTSGSDVDIQKLIRRARVAPRHLPRGIDSCCGGTDICARRTEPGAALAVRLASNANDTSLKFKLLSLVLLH